MKAALKLRIKVDTKTSERIVISKFLDPFFLPHYK